MASLVFTQCLSDLSGQLQSSDYNKGSLELYEYIPCTHLESAISCNSQLRHMMLMTFTYKYVASRAHEQKAQYILYSGHG